MKDKMSYSFDDEPIRNYKINSTSKTININFDGYFDLISNSYKSTPCIWTIKNWEEAKFRVGEEDVWNSLNTNTIVLNMILYLCSDNFGNLELHVLSENDKYLTFLFIKPKFEFNLKHEKN